MSTEFPSPGSRLDPNIGLYTNPTHKIWLDEAFPRAEDAASGEGLQVGEVTVAIKSTGICG